MENPVMRQIYISLLDCRSNLIEMDHSTSLFWPIFGKSIFTKKNCPALCEWIIGARIIDLITTNGQFIHEQSHVKNALKQPSSFQFNALKNQLKPSFLDTHKLTDHWWIRETSPFNIYGKIIYKSESWCSYFYKLPNFKANKTLLWEKSRLSLERDWEKHNIDITIEIPQYEQIIKSILNMKHFNHLKQFMIKLFRNNLYFKNVTSKFAESGILCNSCKSAPEDRIHFFQCKTHLEIIQKLFLALPIWNCFKKVPILKLSSTILVFH